jgi:CRP/FNR family nitrogen fixation transcriptional regulator
MEETMISITATATAGPVPAKKASPSVHSLVGTLEMMGAAMKFDRNEEIYGEGEPADYLYKVVSGAVRVYKVLDDGRRQVAAFYLSGDIFGLELGDEHEASAEALGDCTVLVIKRSTVLALANRDGDVARQLWNMTARELARTQGHMLLLIQNAHERVLSFLQEMAGRGLRGGEIELPMSRQDIADYLGLTIETVSRTLSQLENERAIELLTSRRIRLRTCPATLRKAA